MQQCAEGWHLEDDPLPPEPTSTRRGRLDDERQRRRRGHESDESVAAGAVDRRRPDAVDLPKVRQEHRRVGRTFTAPDGTSIRPSMFVTLTLGSYGK